MICCWKYHPEFWNTGFVWWNHHGLLRGRLCCHHRSFMNYNFINRVNWGYFWGSRVPSIILLVKYSAYEGTLGLSDIGLKLKLLHSAGAYVLTSMGLLKDHCCCLWTKCLWDCTIITLLVKTTMNINSLRRVNQSWCELYLLTVYGERRGGIRRNLRRSLRVPFWSDGGRRS